MLRRARLVGRIPNNESARRAQCSPKCKVLLTRRGYAQVAATSGTTPLSSTPYTDVPEPRRYGLPEMCQGVITTSSPADTPLSALLPNLAKYESSKIYSERTMKIYSHTFLLLLLTTAYARHALDTELPLQTIRWLSGLGRLRAPLNAITAVVDALPGTGGAPREGFAYYLRSGNDDTYKKEVWTRSLPETSNTSNHKDSQSTSDRNNDGLHFLVSGMAIGDAFPYSLSREAKHETNYTVTVPLAQTLFSTGQPTTMQHTHYGVPTSKDEAYHLTSTGQLQSAGVLMSFTRDGGDNGTTHEVSAHFPLTFLTPARRINNSLGNVLRSVSTYPTFGPRRWNPSKLSAEKRAAAQPPADQPASQELEEAISAHFSRLKIPPEPVDVYALVIPIEGRDQGPDFASRSATRRNFHSAATVLSFDYGLDGDFSPRKIDQGILDLIVHGKASLCKVLSGGGGWGDKKGLLSLDPGSYKPPDLTPGARSVLPGNQSNGGSVSGADNVDVYGRSRSAQNMKETVMFFLVSPGSDLSATASALADSGTTKLEASEHWSETQDFTERIRGERAVFGTIPSTMDALPMSAPETPHFLSTDSGSMSTAAELAKSEGKVQHAPYQFGAFSASPLSLTTSKLPLDATFGWRSSLFINENNASRRSTKLGVPNLRLAVERNQKLFKSESRIETDMPTQEIADGRAESDWYVSAEHEPERKVDLSKLRDEHEEAYTKARDSKSKDEIKEFGSSQQWLDKRKAEGAEVARMEGLFERLRDDDDAPETDDPKQVDTKQQVEQPAWGLSSADRPSKSAAGHALSALKSRTFRGKGK